MLTCNQEMAAPTDSNSKGARTRQGIPPSAVVIDFSNDDTDDSGVTLKKNTPAHSILENALHRQGHQTLPAVTGLTNENRDTVKGFIPARLQGPQGRSILPKELGYVDSPNLNPLYNARAAYGRITAQQQPASYRSPYAPTFTTPAASNQFGPGPVGTQQVPPLQARRNILSHHAGAPYPLLKRRADLDGGLLESDIYRTGPLDDNIPAPPPLDYAALLRQGYKPHVQGEPIRLRNSITGDARWCSQLVRPSPAPQAHPTALAKALADSYVMDGQMFGMHTLPAQIPQNQDMDHGYWAELKDGQHPMPYGDPEYGHVYLYPVHESALQQSMTRNSTATARARHQSAGNSRLVAARNAIQVLYNKGAAFGPETAARTAYVLAIRAKFYASIGRTAWVTSEGPLRASALADFSNAANDNECHHEVSSTLKNLINELSVIEYVDPELTDEDKHTTARDDDHELFQQQYFEHNSALLRSICEGEIFSGNENPECLANTHSFIASTDPRARFIWEVDVACMASTLWPDQEFTSSSAALAEVLESHKEYLRHLASSFPGLV